MTNQMVVGKGMSTRQKVRLVSKLAIQLAGNRDCFADGNDLTGGNATGAR
jgi:hypothetical protein